MTRDGRRHALRRLAAGAVALAAPGLAVTARAAAGADPAAGALARIRERGQLVVGLYQDLPPFHVQGRGIDVALGRALAETLGVQMSALPFPAGENMDDDLRNMVWRGHYLGYGPADVLLHVPVEAPLMKANPQVQILAPYYRESVAIARDLQRVPALDSLAPLGQHETAVCGASLAGWLLIGADGGAYRERLTTQHADGTEAARALQRGEVALAAGQRSELECVLGRDPRYAITPLPSPRAPRDGWVVGCAIKSGREDLALALQGAMQQLGRDGRLQALFADGGVGWRQP